MTVFKKLARNDRGAVAVEMAFALPVLTTVMIGILQFGLVLQASGAMRHGIGEGLRLAKIHGSTPAEDVEERVRESLAGVRLDGIESLEFERGTIDGADWGQISMTYEMEPFIPFAPIPPIVLTETKRVWLPS